MKLSRERVKAKKVHMLPILQYRSFLLNLFYQQCSTTDIVNSEEESLEAKDPQKKRK